MARRSGVLLSLCLGLGSSTPPEPAVAPTEPAAPAAPACRTHLDCFGGMCADGACQCPALWDGPNCETLRLQPAKVTNGLRLPNTSTWGGSAIHDPAAGLWWMYASRLIGNCGLKTWTANSEIVAATSPHPDGPFVIKTTAPVLPTFAHNAVPIRISAGVFALAHIGCGHGTITPRAGCRNGSSCNATACWTPPASGPLRPPRPTTPRAVKGSCDNPHFTGMLTASDPAGPWSPVPRLNGSISVDCATVAPCWHKPSITNPSIYPLPNGSVLLAYSTGCTTCNVSAGHKHIGLAFGERFDGPYVDLTPDRPVFPWASEDPCIWRDKADGAAWHMLAHTDFSGVAEDGRWAHVSAHAVAASFAGPWHVAAVPPYTRDIQWASSPPTQVQTRERPQILFDSEMNPVALSNGVMPGNRSSPWHPGGYTGDWTYTHVQLLDPRAGDVDA